ncbi:hypothetical protein BH10PSE12_BH10PSE12_08740 [soil metagenome]
MRDVLTRYWTRETRAAWRHVDAGWKRVGTFHPSAASMIVGTLALVGLCLALAWLCGDPVIATVAGLVCCMAVLRIVSAIRFHHALLGDGEADSRLWERLHELSSWSGAALVGSLALATLLRSGDAGAHMLAITLAAAYGGGISGRNAGHLALTVGQSILVFGPASAGLWMAGGTAYHLLAAGLAIMMLGMAEISAASHRVVVQALRGQKDKALLAAKYERLARYDSLTGVENRMAMQMRLRDLFESNSKPQDALAILWIDLDRFKEINDTLGHIVGDHLLCTVSEKLAEALDGRGHVARFGGDEFVLVCPDVDRQMARGIADDVMTYFRHSFEVGGHNLAVTASIGIAVAPQDGRDIDELMQHADVALYEAKRDGRNRAVCFTWSMKERFNRVHEIETGLRRAIDQGELAMHYQPIFNLETGKVAACEALMRWDHPTLGRVPPDEFIPAAEKVGLIEPITTWALREACAAAVQWPNDVRVAVNISPASLTSGELPRTVIAVLLETGLSARRLELEVTESLFLEDNRHTSQILRELQLIGLKLVLDDFGTGYSSLSYLRSYRFDTIKVDQSFMVGIGESREDQAIVRAVGHIARALNMETVAEGVETEEQLRHAREAGFDGGQGFLLCPPQTRARMLEIMTAGTGMPAELITAPVVRRRQA